MARTGTYIKESYCRTMLARDHAAEAADAAWREREMRRRAIVREREMKKMTPVFSLFKYLNSKKISPEGIDLIISGLKKAPIAISSLITRLGDELEKRGVSREPWESQARKFFKNELVG